MTTTSIPSARAAAHLLDGGDGAVHRHEQLRAARSEALDGRPVQPVAVACAVRQVGVDVCAKPRKHAHEHRRRADPVDVVVAVDRDPITAPHVGEDRLDGLADAGERRRRVLVVGREEGTRPDRVCEPAAHEHLRDRAAHAELALEPPHVGIRARGISKRVPGTPATLRPG